jgi:hypothetical protein
VFTARYGLGLYVFCGSENKQRLFLYTVLYNRFITEAQSVYCAVRPGSLNATDTVRSKCV